MPPSLSNSVIEIPVGDNLNVICDASNNNFLLDVQVTWLDPLGNVVPTNPQNELQINGVMFGDAGNYICQFQSNQGDIAQDSFTLQAVGMFNVQAV